MLAFLTATPESPRAGSGRARLASLLAARLPGRARDGRWALVLIQSTEPASDDRGLLTGDLPLVHEACQASHHLAGWPPATPR